MSTLGIFRWKYGNNVDTGYTLIPGSTDRNIQQYFGQLANKLKDFDLTINDDLTKRLHGCLKGRLHLLHKQQLRLIYRYMNEINPLLRLLTETSNDTLNRTVRNRVQLALTEAMTELTHSLEDLKRKTQFINELENRGFKYHNVVDDELRKDDNKQGLEHLLMKINRRGRILCSTDDLNSNNRAKFDGLLQQLAGETLHPVYADLSYSSFKLPEMMIFPSSTNLSESKLSPPDYDVINILLLGETGVGKSTFINAFVNYLTFDTLEQAEMNKPVVLIPVSFLVTTGHHFDEHLIKFGDFDSNNDEDFTHPGQSVTQHCKQHRFDLRRDLGKKLCIIDTPGFGDTRGLDQDDLNMQHILKYIKNLTHLNAICFLLKPNSSRLNIFFRTCLTQLLDLFGSNIRQNIVFCFTNSRSTSFTPGDTAPLLRAMLDSLSIKDISFKKENTFCFDSESFRYLVALQDKVQFEQVDKHEYELSWKTSVSESHRLLNYVRNKLNAYPLHNEWQSKEHGHIELVQMIRPMLETMRNILRNLILRKATSSNKCIKLCPNPVHRPTGFCTSCQRDPFPLANFWILPDHPHQIENKCLTCGCQTNEHLPADYLLSYEIFNDLSSPQSNEMENTLDQLYLASAEFAYFLTSVTRSTKEDPFFAGLMRMIKEEQMICATKPDSNQFNLQLLKELEILKEKYQGEMKKLQSSQQQRDLPTIYKRIQTISEFPSVHEQIAVIRKA